MPVWFPPAKAGKWLRISTATERRVHSAATLENSLKVEIQGTTKAASVAPVAADATKTAASGLKMLKNSGWILNIRNADKLGLLEEEVEVLRKLALDGYYFVIRSCNPARR